MNITKQNMCFGAFRSYIFGILYCDCLLYTFYHLYLFIILLFLKFYNYIFILWNMFKNKFKDHIDNYHGTVPIR